MTNLGKLLIRLFLFILLLFFSCHNCIPFRSRSRPIFDGSGSGSGSEQTVSAAPAPAPAPTKMCRLRRLRLRLRLRLRIPGYSLCSSHGWDISARTHVHTALLHLRNGSADCVQIWYVGWGSLTKCLPQVMGGMHLHVRTCAPLFQKCSPFCYSVTIGSIVLKFGMHLETH